MLPFCCYRKSASSSESRQGLSRVHKAGPWTVLSEELLNIAAISRKYLFTVVHPLHITSPSGGLIRHYRLRSFLL